MVRCVGLHFSECPARMTKEMKWKRMPQFSMAIGTMKLPILSFHIIFITIYLSSIKQEIMLISIAGLCAYSEAEDFYSLYGFLDEKNILMS